MDCLPISIECVSHGIVLPESNRVLSCSYRHPALRGDDNPVRTSSQYFAVTDIAKNTNAKYLTVHYQRVCQVTVKFT